MDGRILARLSAIVFVAVAISATMIEMSRRDEPSQRVSTPVNDPLSIDPLREAQRRCQQMGEAARNDLDCLRVWAETRDRFLGLDAQMER